MDDDDAFEARYLRKHDDRRPSLMAVDGSQAYSTIPDVIPAESVVIPIPGRKSPQDVNDLSRSIDLSLDVDYLDYAADMAGGGPGSATAEEFRSPMLQFPMLHDDEEPSELFTRNPLYRELVIEVQHQTTCPINTNIFSLGYAIAFITLYFLWSHQILSSISMTGNGTRNGSCAVPRPTTSHHDIGHYRRQRIQ